MQRHSILAELGWLVYFLVVLVIAVYAVNIVVNVIFPRHFNSTVADLLAGLAAAAIYVATRAARARRSL